MIMTIKEDVLRIGILEPETTMTIGMISF